MKGAKSVLVNLEIRNKDDILTGLEKLRKISMELEEALYLIAPKLEAEIKEKSAESPLEKKEEATKKEDIKVSIDDFDKAAGDLLRNVQDSILASRIIGLVIGTLRAKLFVKG
jgi:hypothetical protein